MDSQQQAFLEHIGMLIPKLFDAIRLGNVKSEYVLGDRIIGRRQVRLKLVAEVVDPGSNPLATHSQMRKQGGSADVQGRSSDNQQASSSDAMSTQTSSNPSPNKPVGPRRGPRRKHPMSS